MRKGIKFRLRRIYARILRGCRSVWGQVQPAYVIFPDLSPEPFSDAELTQCIDALRPLGYTLIRKATSCEIVLYRQSDLQERERAVAVILQKLKRYAS